MHEADSRERSVIKLVDTSSHIFAYTRAYIYTHVSTGHIYDKTTGRGRGTTPQACTSYHANARGDEVNTSILKHIVTEPTKVDLLAA